ncbi:MAG: hypothetical protein NTX29_09550 [Actinobacteria bacterium]|nr:hypothetical protein [Actinomycetota bacterium]
MTAGEDVTIAREFVARDVGFQVRQRVEQYRSMVVDKLDRCSDIGQ